jgi:chemotaxis protein MotB
MIKKLSLGLLLLAITTSCVSKKVYADLENKLTDLKKENRTLADENEALKLGKNQFETDNATLKTELEKAKLDRDKLANEYTASDNNFKALQSAYNALEKDSGEALQSNLGKNRDLLAQLQAKEKALASEKDRLAKLNADLKDRSDRVNELEGLIAAKEAAMKKLKETLSKSLKAFEGKGLTIQQKDGKVYVSMENKLLFESGSWAVGAEGKKAVVAVGKVLGDNPDLSVLIEGHTDNDKFSGAVGQIENNWDLSTKRATAIVNIIGENTKVKKENLTAAGRGEHSPLMSNDTPEGKAKNRRIEIILTPKLDEISKMLNEI